MPENAKHARTVNEICDAILARIDASDDYYVNQYSNDVLHAIVEAVRLDALSRAPEDDA